jgi:hypothetical protein
MALPLLLIALGFLTPAEHRHLSQAWGKHVQRRSPTPRLPE